MATLRASHLIFAGFVLLILMGPWVYSLSDGKSSIAALIVMYALALGWQILTVILNPRRPSAWVMLIGYLGIVAVPAIASISM